jgi:hypothetical protein
MSARTGASAAVERGNDAVGVDLHENVDELAGVRLVMASPFESAWPGFRLRAKLLLQGAQLVLVLDHPRDGTVERVRGAEPRAASSVVAAVGVALVDRDAVLVAGQDVADRRLSDPPDLPDTKGARGRRNSQRV